MCVRYLGFVLLVWIPGVLCAQSPEQHCTVPKLDGGYVVPEKDSYAHGDTLTYACDNGRKPAVEGWWATSTCENGKWFHEPRCIDEEVETCFPPEIPNAEYTANQNGWYEDGNTIRITCDEGYEYKDRAATATCTNGTWSPVLVCEKSINACGEPPKIPHAVIIHQRYQEVFPVDSEVQYECEDGFTVEGADSKIFCIAGNWTEGPPCSRETVPGTGHGGSAEVGTGGGHTTSAGSSTQPAGGGRETVPGTGHGGSAEVGTGGGHTTSAGSSTQPAGGGSSTTSGWNDRDSGPPFVTIDHCGAHPKVPNGAVVQEERKFLKYQCNAFYTLVGLDTVVCHSGGSWSQLPICQETFCVLEPDRYASYDFKQSALSGVKYLKDGEKRWFPCIWSHYSRVFQCTNRRIRYTNCCHDSDIQRGLCLYTRA